MALDPDHVQARLTLISFVYQETLRGATQALAIAGAPPLSPEEKEVLFGEVEKAVWSFGDDLFADPPAKPEDWVDRAADVPAIADAVKRGVGRVLADRRDRPGFTRP